MRGQGLSIEVAVPTLVKTLEANRTKHLKDYEKAKRGWKKLLAKDLTALQADLESDKSIPSTRLYLKPKPEHFLGEYDEAIEMLKYSNNVTTQLDQQQFRAYVKDEWDWKNSWTASNTTYIAAGR